MGNSQMDSHTKRVIHFALLSMLLISTCTLTGCNTDGVGPPTGKTGNQWTIDDFADSTSELALKGGPEFVEYCKENGKYELKGPVFEKFKEILAKYPAADPEEYDHFSVLIRQRLVEAGMIPKGDPERYQYQVAMMCIAVAE